MTTVASKLRGWDSNPVAGGDVGCRPRCYLRSVTLSSDGRPQIGTRIGTPGERGLDDLALAGIRAVVGVALRRLNVSVTHPLLERAHRDSLSGERGPVAVPEAVKAERLLEPAAFSAARSRSYISRFTHCSRTPPRGGVQWYGYFNPKLGRSTNTSEDPEPPRSAMSFRQYRDVGDRVMIADSEHP